MDLFVFTFHHDQNIYRALSPLSPDQVGSNGLPTEAVLGEISAALPSMTPDQFEQNEAFVAVLHDIIRTHAASVQGLTQQAASLGRGELPIIDLRTDVHTVAPEDILGSFDVTRGEIQAERYRPNDQYRVLTEKGPTQLDPVLETYLLEHLTTLPIPENNQSHG